MPLKEEATFEDTTVPYWALVTAASLSGHEMDWKSI